MAENKIKSLPSGCAVECEDLVVCLTCWNFFEKLANHSFLAFRIMPLLELDVAVRKEVRKEKWRLRMLGEIRRGDHVFFWDINRMFQGGPEEQSGQLLLLGYFPWPSGSSHGL